MNSLVSYPLFFLSVMAVVLFYPLRRPERMVVGSCLRGVHCAGAVDQSGNQTFDSYCRTAIRSLLPIRFSRNSAGALLLFFFAVFPVSSPIDRRMPWLKTALISLVLLFELPAVLLIASTGSYAPLFEVAERIKPHVDPVALPVAYSAGSFMLGLVSLVWNGLTAPQREARRQIRVMALGMTIAVGSLLSLTLYV